MITTTTIIIIVEIKKNSIIILWTIRTVTIITIKNATSQYCANQLLITNIDYFCL